MPSGAAGVRDGHALGEEQSFLDSKVFSSILMDRRRKEKNLLCSGVSSLSTGFEHAAVCQWTMASIFFGWQHGLGAVVVSLGPFWEARAMLPWLWLSEQVTRGRVSQRIPERFSREREKP